MAEDYSNAVKCENPEGMEFVDATGEVYRRQKKYAAMRRTMQRMAADVRGTCG